MDTTDSRDQFREATNEVTRISCLFDQEVLDAIDKLNMITNISNFEKDLRLAFKNYWMNNSTGQGVLFHSHTEYFKKDRESRLVYKKYLMNRNYTRYNRKTVKVTKYPVRMCGWKGKR